VCVLVRDKERTRDQGHIGSQDISALEVPMASAAEPTE
jgi:hypothetical protein